MNIISLSTAVGRHSHGSPELSSLKQSRAIQWYPAAQGPPGTCSRHDDSWTRATRKKGLFQTPGAKVVECQKVHWRELTRLHKRAYHGRGTGNRVLGSPVGKKSLDVNISVGPGPLFSMCLPMQRLGPSMGCISDDCPRSCQCLQDPDDYDSRVLVPSGPLAIFNSKPVFICS